MQWEVHFSQLALYWELEVFYSFFDLLYCLTFLSYAMKRMSWCPNWANGKPTHFS